MVSLTETVRFIESLFGRGSISRDERNISVRCPICDPKDPTKKKLVVRITDHITHCWVCGFSSRTLTPLIKKFGTRDQLNTYISTLSPINQKRELLESQEELQKKLDIPEDIRLLASIDSLSPDQRAVLNYLYSRGVTDKDLWYYRLACSSNPKWDRRVVFISHDDCGKPNYLTGRAIDSKKFPKYINCDVERTTVVFNELNIDWGSPLVLCEGPFDLLRCGENATCMLGSEISEKSLLFDRIITNSTPVILAMDSDTYASKRPRVIKKLLEYDINVSLVDLGTYPDPGSAPKQFMLEQISLARQVDWMTNLMTKLSQL